VCMPCIMVLPKTIITLYATFMIKFYQMILVGKDARQVEKMQYVQTYNELYESITTFH
jgi:hypothetical protein